MEATRNSNSLGGARTLRDRDSVRRKVFKLRMWGFRLGPTDGPDPLLTSVHSPFNLLRLFKDDVHRSKTDCIIM